MYSSCEFDVCSSDEDDVHCQTLESTALACSQHGFQVKKTFSSQLENNLQILWTIIIIFIQILCMTL
jgi:hypothetical protein